MSDPAKPHADRRASDIGKWICEKHDGEKIPNPGIIVIGKLYAGMEAFNAPAGILPICAAWWLLQPARRTQGSDMRKGARTERKSGIHRPCLQCGMSTFGHEGRATRGTNP